MDKNAATNGNKVRADHGSATKQPWKPWQLRKLRAMYPHKRTDAVANAVRRPVYSVYNKAMALGLKKTPAYLASPDACRLRRGKHVGEAFQFKKGMTPWNLGKTGYMGANRTSFRKGQMPHNHRPIGSERLSKDGYLERKVSEPKRWRAVHVMVWEAAHGKIKRGHIVVFKAGVKKDAKLAPVIADLECITRAENMRRNTYHRYPKEIARLIQLRGALNRQINKRADREEQNRGSTQSPVRDDREGEGRRHAAGPSKGGRGARAGNHQQRQGGNGSPKGARQDARNRVHTGGRTTRHSAAAGAR